MVEKSPVIKYYSVIKKNEVITYTGKYMELEIMILSEVTQVQKDKHPWSHLIDCGYHMTSGFNFLLLWLPHHGQL